MRADATLVEAARSGDQQAIVALLAASQPDLKRFARKTCSRAEDAEDAVQLALWQLYRQIGALRTAATFATWMFRIVERECFRLFRGRDIAVSADAEDSDILLNLETADTLDLRIDMARAIKRLPPPYRDALLLRDVDELTAPEAASRLAITPEALKSRLHRARGMVRDDLVANGYALKVQSPDKTPHG